MYPSLVSNVESAFQNGCTFCVKVMKTNNGTGKRQQSFEFLPSIRQLPVIFLFFLQKKIPTNRTSDNLPTVGKEYYKETGRYNKPTFAFKYF